MGLAFGFVIAAGLATTIGSSFAFCSSLADQRLLAGALGISAGVMLYVSFAEIFMVKSVGSFEESGFSNDESVRYATFCFFGGITVTALLDKVVHFIADCSGHSHDHGPVTHSPSPVRVRANPLHANPVTHEPERVQEMRALPASASEQSLVPDSQDFRRTSDTLEEGGANGEIALANKEDQDARRKAELQKMGLLTGLAIGLHNFPEGLATFVATLADSTVGGAIALAIALHNIPEGVCVAMPIYYATGSRWKGFWWSFASGVSEPIGGLMGYLVLYGDNMSETAYGALFGCVGGMMVYISLVELIPTALKYDPEDKYVSSSVLVGMSVMAASLLLFVL